jgi:hypothetical protein
MTAALDCFSLTLKVHSKKAQTHAPGLSRRAQKDDAQVKRSKTVFEQDRVDGARS